MIQTIFCNQLQIIPRLELIKLLKRLFLQLVESQKMIWMIWMICQMTSNQSRNQLKKIFQRMIRGVMPTLLPQTSKILKINFLKEEMMMKIRGMQSLKITIANSKMLSEVTQHRVQPTRLLQLEEEVRIAELMTSLSFFARASFCVSMISMHLYLKLFTNCLREKLIGQWIPATLWDLLITRFFN